MTRVSTGHPKSSADQVNQPTQSQNNPAGLQVCLINCRSVVNKLAEIEILLLNESIDILCITESWLNPSIPDEIVTIPGYNLYRRDRQNTDMAWSGLGGGGVAVFVRGDISCEVHSESNLRNCEMLTLQIKHQTKLLYLIVMYRPPRHHIASFCAELDQLSELLDDKYCIIAGDFNAKHCDWKSSDETDSNGRALELVFLKYGINVINQGIGTRPQLNGDRSKNPLLDLIASNNPTIATSFRVLEPLSDHCPVIISLTLNTPHSRPTHMYRTAVDSQCLRRLAEQEPFLERVTGDVHIDAAWQAWDSHFHDLIQRSSFQLPMKEHRKHSWYTAELHKLKRLRDRLYHQCLRNPLSTAIKATYRLVRNFYRKKLRAARDQSRYFLAAGISKNCHQGGYIWWKRAKRFCNINSQKKTIPDLTLDSVTTTTASEKAELLAQHFARQCSQPTQPGNVTDAATASAESVTSLLKFSCSSPEEIYEDLTHLSPHKSTSANYIIPFLRLLADLICGSLSYLFNRSLHTSTFPSSWKATTVIPLFKNRGSTSSPSNYRPISLLHPVSRIFERRLAAELTEFLSQNDRIHVNQFAYVPQRSTTDQLILLTHQMAQVSDAGGHFDCAFLDFTKAFDKVHHETLIKILNSIMEPSTLTWLESYLDRRTIQVKLESSLSSPHTINAGVPQGSHLAPILFLVYINGLPDNINHSEPYLFADDVTLFHSHIAHLSITDNILCLQQDLNNCQRWAESVHGSFSAEKTSIVSNYGIAPSSSPVMDGKEISLDVKATHLGIDISVDLQFTTHFLKILKKFRMRVNLLCHMGLHLNPQSISLLYKAYVRPAVEYAVPVWFCRVPLNLLAKLDVLQAKVCRRLLKSAGMSFDRYETKENLNKLCMLESLHFRRTCMSLITLFKIIHNNPRYLSTFNITVTRSERRPNKLLFNTHGRISSSLFLHKVGKLWNCLPPAITKLASLPEFKKAVRLHLFNIKFSNTTSSLSF